MPWVFAEGGYNTRLEVDRRPRDPGRPHDLDVRRHRHGARQGDRRRPPGIGGNVPGTLLTMGSRSAVDAYVKDLLGKTATDGGFVLGSGIVLDEADPACFKAFIEPATSTGPKV